MSEEVTVSKVEVLKAGSRQLRGTIAEQLDPANECFTDDNVGFLKHHGTYQQDNRDDRGGKSDDGSKMGKSYMMMVRSRIPGGRLTAGDLLAELDMCDEFGNGTLRITSRQGLQLHGVLKDDLRPTIRSISEKTTLTTLGACGDVNRNVMCCPAPIRNNAVHDQLQELSQQIAHHFRPHTTAYQEIWLQDDEGDKEKVAEFTPVEEPIYGECYLPRKFKIGIALPEDNCVDILTYDLGLLAIVENDQIVGYNVYVGGGQGVTPAAKKTYAAVGLKMTFVPADKAIAVAEAIVRCWSDNGNRVDRKQARIKYLVREWGLEKFKSKVEEYFGSPLPEPRAQEVCDVDDHMGWHEQGDGKLYLGINVENGRIKDDGDLQLKTGLRAILNQYSHPVRLTALQGLILCDVDPADRDGIEQLMVKHGIKKADELSLVRRFSMACPALPTCGLSVTESERVMPRVIDDLEVELDKHGLKDERIAVHMTGCPNGCARPYSPDIGLVGKSRGKYTLYLGGNTLGTRIGFIYQDQVPLEEIGSTVSPLLGYFKSERTDGESFGDFCARKGLEDLQQHAAV
ncbi:MAG: NADPH-dependent assimilatory sulfite reductase hemoprotein subunit [Planctomycetota bacterium]|nr:NADPH-dependent assimilatory sulfite reductase hemoprotein subunit [Planctomycetota bacterium]MDA1164878.1 NADPH-dependent assimilatory sulfite reductase hemoprotein subunit [Planctomycetota bacterium]